jgi:hypothetical protein
VQAVGQPTREVHGEGCGVYFDADCKGELISGCYVYERLVRPHVIIGFDADGNAMCIERGTTFSVAF